MRSAHLDVFAMNFVKDLYDLLTQLLPPFVPYQFLPTHLPAPAEPRPKVTQQCPRYVDILTYNIEYTTCRNEFAAVKVASAIVQSNADIVLLQETNPSWEGKLSTLIPIDSAEGGGRRYPHRYFHHPTGRPAGGSAILSMWPISNARVLDLTNTVEGSVFPTLVGTVHVQSAGGEKDHSSRTFTFANVHLRPPLELDGTASLSTARTTGSVRDAEASEILRSQPPEGFHLVAGDFNEHDGGRALSRMMTNDGGLADALAEHVPTSRETHRWPFLLGTTLRKRLDHILYSRSELTCLGCGVMTGFEEGASDHQPVLARLEFVTNL